MNPKSQNTSNSDSDREVKKIVGALSKITSRSPEEIEPQLEALIDRLNQAEENDLVNYSFYVTSTCEQWSAEFHQWIDSHKGKDIPVLGEEAMRRDMYPDRW